MGKARDLARLSPNTSGQLPSSNIADSSITSSKIADGAIVAGDLASTLDLTGKTVTLPSGVGGKILQVVSQTYSNLDTRTTSSSAVATGLTASITPSSVSSKVLVQMNPTLFNDAWSQTGCEIEIFIYRNGTSIYKMYANNWTDIDVNPIDLTVLDTPSSTSSVTYTLYIRRSAIYTGNPVVGIYSKNGCQMTATLMEVAA